MRAVLFDLDGTLLDLDLDAFFIRYFAALEHATAPLAEQATRPGSFMAAFGDATRAMMRPHPGLTNRQVFHDDFLARTSVDLDAHWPLLEVFYRDVFPQLAGTACAKPGAHRALAVARRLGLRIAIATNPLFPRIAVDHRLAWAGLTGADVDLVTTYEQMEACKPYPAYFLQTAALLGVGAKDCLMVGDDENLDMPARAAGMRTYYVGPNAKAIADFKGDLERLADLLPELL